MGKLKDNYESETGLVASRIMGVEQTFTRDVLIYDRDYVEWLEKKLTKALDNKAHLLETAKITKQLRDQLIKDGLLDPS